MVTEEKLHDPCGCHLSLDFVNSIGRSDSGVEQERLSDYRALIVWSTQAGTLTTARARVLLREARAKPRAAENVLRRARAFREAMFRVFDADVHDQAPAASDLDAINVEIACSLARARVQRASGGFEWAWCSDPDALDRPLWPIARAAGELLVSEDRQQIRECASDTCRWLFLDRSKNHGRRWCDMRSCGNLDKVRRHRRKRAKH